MCDNFGMHLTSLCIYSLCLYSNSNVIQFGNLFFSTCVCVCVCVCVFVCVCWGGGGGDGYFLPWQCSTP